MYLRHTPAAPLSLHVDTLWYASREALPHSRERSLPTGRVDLVIPLLQAGVVRYDSADATQGQHISGAVLSGAHDRVAVRGMGGPSCVMGVHFRPGGAAALLRWPLAELRNQTVSLADRCGPADEPLRTLRERLQAAPGIAQKFSLLEDVLLSLLARAGPPDKLVNAALRVLAQDPAQARIGAVRRAAGCSPQAFIRRFEAAVGLTPKRYARVLRFNALLPQLARVGPRDWAQLAAAGGWFDQSHLVHDFGRLSGLRPTAYAPVRADQPTHVAIGDGDGDGVALTFQQGRKNLQDTLQRGV